jgi:5-methylcytosine-specific restriction endonuclease McrBC regulatory subunit McrC
MQQKQKNKTPTLLLDASLFSSFITKQSKKHWKKNTHIHSTQKDWMYARVNSSNIFFSAP